PSLFKKAFRPTRSKSFRGCSANTSALECADPSALWISDALRHTRQCLVRAPREAGCASYRRRNLKRRGFVTRLSAGRDVALQPLCQSTDPLNRPQGSMMAEQADKFEELSRQAFQFLERDF